ncbi:hypothetical protein ACLVWU_14835 [Bdellovibrio sp. HCB290]|uniref:hypothetical protein n=1 Tax=Bdellovibrio sp. HCB290 TaxID=3394356 RepID=UPI0039B36506
MNKRVYLVILLVLACVGGFAAYAGSQIKATSSFADGSTAELVEIISDRGIVSQIIQIKDASGAVCYSVSNVANQAPGVSCVK